MENQTNQPYWQQPQKTVVYLSFDKEDGKKLRIKSGDYKGTLIPNIKGKFNGLKIVTSEYEGRETEQLQIELLLLNNKEKEYWRLSTSFTSLMACDLISSLANPDVDTFDDIVIIPNISIDPNTKKEYKHCSIMQNDRFIKKSLTIPKLKYYEEKKGKLTPAEMKQQVENEMAYKTSIQEKEEFLRNMVDVINEKFGTIEKPKSNFMQTQEQAPDVNKIIFGKSVSEAIQEKQAENEENNDNLPF